MKIAAAYIRVSTDDQTELSPDSQIKQVREYASAHDYIVPDEYIYRDDGISGRTARKRPAFNEMIGTAKLKPKPFDAILVWKFSRFARNREDSIVYKSMLRKLGIEVISISEPTGDDKMSVLIEAMIEAMDEYYSINLAEEVKRGMLEKLSRGKCVNSAPIGYTFKDGELVIDEEKAFIVRRIYQEYANGKTMLQIARDLNNDGIKTLHGNNFENRTVEYILRNPLYAGKLRYTQGGGGSRSHYHSDIDTMIVDGSHAPVIEPKVWDDIQSKINATKLKYKKYERDTPVKHNTMLRGLIKCSSCGSTLCINSTGHYQCNAYAHGKCNVSHSIKEEKINEAVINALEVLDINGEITLSVRRPQIQDDKYEQYSKLLKREYTKLERVKEAYQNGIDTLEEYKRNKAKIMADIDKIQSLMKKYETSKSTEKSKKTELKSKYEHFIDLVNDPETPPDKLNSALKGFVEKIVFDRVKSSISIFYYC
jgi:DNA invertase Pin-like site-specific DNA recombinase